MSDNTIVFNLFSDLNMVFKLSIENKYEYTLFTCDNEDCLVVCRTERGNGTNKEGRRGAEINKLRNLKLPLFVIYPVITA